VPEDTHCGSHTQSFGEGAEDFSYATGGGFEAVQDRAVTDTEFRPTGLAFEILDVFSATVAAVPDEGMDLLIRNPVIGTVGIGTDIPGRRDPLLAERAARAFYAGIGNWESG